MEEKIHDFDSSLGLAAGIGLDRIRALAAALRNLLDSDLDGLCLGGSLLVRITCARYHRSGSDYNDESIDFFHDKNELKMVNRCKYIQ